VARYKALDPLALLRSIRGGIRFSDENIAVRKNIEPAGMV